MSQAQQLANLSQAYTAGPLGMRNRLINGDCRVNQRGLVTNTANALSMCGTDRWYVWPNGSTVQTVNDWQSPVSYGALRIIGAAGNTGVNVGQRIERANMWDMVGKVVTLSGYVIVPTAVAIPVMVLYPNSNDSWGGGWSVGIDWKTVLSPPTPDTWTPFSYTFTVPAACVAGMAVEVGLGPVLAGKNAAISGMQLELGSVATPFELRPYSLEEQMCQRYFERAAFIGCSGVIYTPNGDTRILIPFKTTKRIVPTSVTLDSTQMGVIAVGDAGNQVNVNLTGMTATKINNYGFGVAFSGTTAIQSLGAVAVIGTQDTFMYAANAEL